MLLQRVRQFIRQHALFDAGTRVLAAVSGGSDSVALAAILAELAAADDMRLTGVVHFNHQLRADADRDERHAAAMAGALGVPFLAGGADVGSCARRDRQSLELAARGARYAFFESARVQCDADVVALGHTRDDQAETVLLRLLRGSGPRGLAAMYPRRGFLVRPLLDCSRTDLRRYLDDRKIAYVDDETNNDVAIPRNRVRAELLPLLKARFNPAVVDALVHEAELSREIWAWLDVEATAFEEESVVDSLSGSSSSSRELDVDRLRLAPLPLRRLVLWRAMTAMAAGRTVSFAHVEDGLGVLAKEGCAIDAPGQTVQRLGARLVLTSKPPRRAGRPRSSPTLFQYPVSIPGEVALAEADCILSVEVVTGSAGQDVPSRIGKGLSALVRRDRCYGPLAVRNRRPGDRFRPVGLDGQKKLQDYFVDRKVGRILRDRVPLVVDEKDQIIWVAGYSIDEAFRVTDASQSMLLLRLKLLGGSA